MSSQNCLELHAPAKINLTLEILYRRADGYHQLRTVLQELALADTILLDEAPEGRLEFFCDDPRLPLDEANLACRAAVLLQDAYAPGRGARISLQKKIPVAAGLGGGSSDAAAVLKGLNRFWGLDLPREKLHGLAARLGSDVPFFLYGSTALGEGRGDIIHPLPSFPHAFVLLACLPQAALSTPLVYRALNWEKNNKGEKTSLFVRLLKERLEQENSSEDLFERLLGLMVNDLEAAAFKLLKELIPLKQRLRQLGLATLLSGSGPTMFAVSRDPDKLNAAREKIAAEGYVAILTSLAHYREEGGNEEA